MAYANKETKAIIAANLKPVLKKFGMKGSLSVRYHHAIVLTLTSGPIDFGSKFTQVNPYWFHEHYMGTAKKFLSEAIDALKSASWYDRSDASVDYFDTAYYFDINIGRWNKDYELVV